MPPYEQPTGQPSGVPPFASWGSRALAYIIDGLIVGVVPLIVYIALIAADNSDVAGIAAGVLGFLLSILYYPLTMGRAGDRNGQTIGMGAMNIRVVRESGEAVSGGFAFVRQVLVLGILMGICFIVQILNYLSPLWDDRNQAWHDKIVGTLVVKA